MNNCAMQAAPCGGEVEMKKYVLEVMASPKSEVVSWTKGEERVVADGYVVMLPNGNTIWMPEKLFEDNCLEGEIVDEDEVAREDSRNLGGLGGGGMSFAGAISCIRSGERVRRTGWNGKGMYVFLASNVEFYTEANIGEFHRSGVEVKDMIVMRTADGSLQPGWLASQADMLADDWEVVK